MISPSEYPRGLNFRHCPSLLMPTQLRPPDEPRMLQGPRSSPLLPEGVAGRILCGGGSAVLGKPCDPGYHAARARSLVTSLDTAGPALVISCGFFKIRRNHNCVCCSLQKLYLDFWLHNKPGISDFLLLFHSPPPKEDEST